jgi:hypothetical protein
MLHDDQDMIIKDLPVPSNHKWNKKTNCGRQLHEHMCSKVDIGPRKVWIKDPTCVYSASRIANYLRAGIHIYIAIYKST